MDNYEILETIHKSKNGETIVFKVKEKCIWVEKKIMSVININNDENCRIGR